MPFPAMTLHIACRDWLGIPESQIPPDHYTLLGLPLFTEDRKQVEQSARARAKIVRPRCLKYHEVGTQLLNAIAAAHICLTDPARKLEYDALLRSGGRVAAVEYAGQSTAHLPLPALGALFDQLETGDEVDIDALLPPGLSGESQAADIAVTAAPQAPEVRPPADAPAASPAGAKSADEPIDAESVENDPPAEPRTLLPIVLAGLVRRAYMSLANELGHAAAISACIAAGALVAILAVVIGRSFNSGNEDRPTLTTSTAAAADSTAIASEPFESNPTGADVGAALPGEALPQAENGVSGAEPRETFVGRLVRIECRRDPVTSEQNVALYLAAVPDPPTVAALKLPSRPEAIHSWWTGEIECFTSAPGFQAKIDDYQSLAEARDAWRALQFDSSAFPKGDLVAVSVKPSDAAAAASIGSISSDEPPPSPQGSAPPQRHELVEVQRVGAPASRAVVDQPRDPATIDALRITLRLPIHLALRDSRGREKTYRMSGTLTRTPDASEALFQPDGSEVKAVIRSRGPVFPAVAKTSSPTWRHTEVEVVFGGQYDPKGQPILELVSVWNWQAR